MKIFWLKNWSQNFEFIFHIVNLLQFCLYYQKFFLHEQLNSLDCIYFIKTLCCILTSYLLTAVIWWFQVKQIESQLEEEYEERQQILREKRELERKMGEIGSMAPSRDRGEEKREKQFPHQIFIWMNRDWHF